MVKQISSPCFVYLTRLIGRTSVGSGLPFSRDSDEELELLELELGDELDDDDDEELELDDDEELLELELDDELELPSDQFLLRCGFLRPASRSLMIFP